MLLLPPLLVASGVVLSAVFSAPIERRRLLLIGVSGATPVSTVPSAKRLINLYLLLNDRFPFDETGDLDPTSPDAGGGTP